MGRDFGPPYPRARQFGITVHGQRLAERLRSRETTRSSNSDQTQRQVGHRIVVGLRFQMIKRPENFSQCSPLELDCTAWGCGSVPNWHTLEHCSRRKCWSLGTRRLGSRLLFRPEVRHSRQRRCRARHRSNQTHSSIGAASGSGPTYRCRPAPGLPAYEHSHQSATVSVVHAHIAELVARIAVGERFAAAVIRPSKVT